MTRSSVSAMPGEERREVRGENERRGREEEGKKGEGRTV